MQSLIAPDWLKGHLEEVTVADVRWYLSDLTLGRREFLTGHIPGAVYLDVESDLSAAEGPGRHPLPTREEFAQILERAGIGNTDFVVAYGSSGGAIAARLWWMLRWLGHENVGILDGGIAGWQQAKGSLSADTPQRAAASFEVKEPLVIAVDRSYVQDHASEYRLVDARSTERYYGIKEPVDSAAGHIPGAINVPFVTNLAADGRFLSPEALGEKYEDAPTIAYCGSGVTACHIIFAKHLAGQAAPLLYEGSWSDWAQNGGAVSTGA